LYEYSHNDVRPGDLREALRVRDVTHAIAAALLTLVRCTHHDTIHWSNGQWSATPRQRSSSDH